mmetsp:Transcript_4736/g.16654  ORF Transcript_4736/g.16654 Transcript_4736/m.16654 type:complete len:247 (-) Transcript_4736:192-932(-)
MRFSKRRRMAGSSTQGMLEAPSTNTPVSSLVATPFICTRNSVLMRLADSLSWSLRALHSESISSIKMIAGFCSRAISNRLRTSFSLSPSHLETRSEEDTLKKVLFASVATALARKDLPVPGGPYSRMPFQGLRLPEKSCGKRMGMITASFRLSFAWKRPATSSHRTLGLSFRIAPSSAFLNFCFSAPSSSPFAPSPSVAPIALRGFCLSFSRNSLSCSARWRYSVTLLRTTALLLSLFSYFSAVMK